MKVIKAMKKLKFWSRKKKPKKKNAPFFTEQQHSSAESSYYYYHHHHCHYYPPVEPSAPPLPSWLDYGRTPETISGTDHFASTTTSSATGGGSSRATFTATEDERAPFSSQEEINDGENITSYQQYMVENPVYGVPALPPQVTTERNAGVFGCVFSFGALLFRCFFPCFHIREANINK